jgi:hypothetical protein
MKTLNKILLLFCICSLALSCRDDSGDEQPKIARIAFEEEIKRSYEGDIAKITVIAEPREAKAYDKIQYWVSGSDVIEILPESDNDGVVYKGLKAGKAVIQASVNGISAFSSVTVIGAGGTIIPYIIVSDYVIECEKGAKENIVASLVGGSPADESGFTMSCSGQNVINLIQTNNIGVIEAANTGTSVITISHIKAQFSVNVLVFVKEKGDVPIYITTDDNVINLNVNDSIREYAVNLLGKNNNDNHLFRHEILDGDNVIDLRSSNNIGSITPRARGIARIKVSHHSASYPIEIVVVVNEEVEYNYIDVDNTLIVMNEGDFRIINADIAGNVPQDYVNKYVFENEDDSVIEVSNSYYQASIRALKKGRSVIKIKNDYVDFDREVLVVVNGPESLIDQEKYITTNQNVITTEVNGEVQLTMTLVGGNSADANNFVWTVDDGSIIEVTNQHGSVRYNSRAMISSTEEKFEATALIKAKKIGTATITLENPKARNSFSVVVKVYKQGVFGVIPVVIDGPGIYRIEEGKNIDVYLRTVTGLEKNLTNIQWKSGNEDIVSVVSNTNLSGILKGEGEGITTLKVTGDNVKYDYTATVIVGNKEYLNGKPYIYVNNPYMSVVKGESVSFRVRCVNMAVNDVGGLSIVNNSGDIMEMFAYRDNITVTGLALGEGEIIVGGDGLNELKIKVMVEDYDLNPEMPYYLRPEKFIYGMVKGRSIEIPVELVGGITSNEKDIRWEIEDSRVAEIKGNGKKCIITGKNEGQTVLKVSHYKSNNKIEIVIYVVLSDAELKSKVIIYVKDQNLLLQAGETRFISIVTNAGEGQSDFRWGNSNANIVSVRPNVNKINAYIDAVSIGNAVVTVGYGNQIPTAIYVSVISNVYDMTYINVPSIVEMIAGQTMTINAVANNIANKYDIKWTSQDESITRVYGNGDICTVTALKDGKAVIEVRYPGFSKNIVLFVYKNSEEMASAYIFAGEQSRYVINKGDIVSINLVFGIKGYPEYDVTNIRWSTDDRLKIEVNGNGKNASVKGLAAGIGVVSVQDNYGNDIKIEIVVQDTGKAGKYYFSIDSKDRIKGILAGKFEDIEVKVFNGTAEIYNITGTEYTVENSNIIRVEKNEGGVRVYALAGKEGQSYITITHDLVEDARILIYTSITEGGLLNAYPIMVEKSNYLAGKGDSFTVSVQTLNEDSSKLRNISYDLEKKNGVISIQERNKKEIVVNAENEGSEIILVRYNAEVVQRVYVSVVEKGYGLNAGYMVTENIIGLLKGQRYETRVDTDVNGGIIWKSEKDYICDIVETEGKRAVLRANWRGETVITVRRGDIERNILVFVVETQEELNAYNAVNIEQRKYKIFKGGNVSINVHSFQGKVEGQIEYEDYYKYSVPYGNVIEVNAVENNKLNVKGINEGTAAIRIANKYYNSEIIVYIEVYPVEDSGIGVNVKEHYITAEKTLYIIGPEEKDVYIQVGVLPDNFYGDAYWEWAGFDKSIINVDSLGRSAVISPVGKGHTKIMVSNKECANFLDITVIVGERFVSDSGNVPYIYVEKDLFEVVKGGSVLSLPYSIINVSNIVLRNITYQLYSDSITINHDVNNSVFNVQAVKTGIARFDIKYGDLRREVYVLVKENLNMGNIYLTTSENYVISSIGELRNINIELKGYDEIDSSKFKWKVSDDSPKNVVQLVGNGTVGQIYGVSEGSVVINVEHIRNDEFRAVYPLSVNVKIVKDKSREKIVYLTTQRNVIETVEGSQSEMIYVQKVGGDVTKTQTQWSVDNSSIVSLTESNGYSARLNVHKAGSAQITVKNIEADYDLKIVVVVRESTGSNIYITGANSLIWLSPGEKNYKISVGLANGEVKDYNRFTWKVQDQVPSAPNILAAEGKVIGIVFSNEQCLIDAVNLGVAHIRVECPGKADLPLIITVYVSHYKEIEFSSSGKEIVKGEVDIVELNLPAYERMKDKARVWAEDLNGGITNAVDVYYTNSLVMLHAKNTGHAVIKAAVEGKEGCAQMAVSVLERHDPNVNRVIVGKSIHVLSTKSAPAAMNASVTGPDIYDSDLDDIKWEITRNYDEDDLEKKKTLVDIIPKNISATQSKGRTIQLTAQSEGNAVLKVSHPKVTENYWKDIYVVIAEMGNKFTINKKDVTVNMARPETVAVNIVGGTTRDYEEVKWVAKMQQKWDGTLLEIVRVMGSGREVTLYPINNGETEVYAFYNGDFVTVKVSVVSDYYFEFYNSNEFMYPGEVRNLPFDIKPASSNANWIYSPLPDTEPVISYTEIQGSQPGGSGAVSRFLQVTARKEGTASLVGMANGKIATVNIIVAYDYEFSLGKNVSGIVPVVGDPNPAPKYEIKNASGKVTDFSDGIIRLDYTIHPANTYIKCITNPLPNGLTVEITAPSPELDSKNRMVGRGKIIFTGLLEMTKNVEFQQFKTRTYGGEEVQVNGTTTRPSKRTVNVMYYFRNVNLKPFFVRGEGKYSNRDVTVTNTRPPKENTQYKLLKDQTPVEGAEVINSSGDIYNMALGDGEVHYILFDKLYDNAMADIKSISINNSAVYNGGNYTDRVDTELTFIEGKEFNAAIVDFTLNGVVYKAVRLSGGTDYIEYNRVAFDQELFEVVTSPYSSNYGLEEKYTEIDLYENSYIIANAIPVSVPVYAGSWYKLVSRKYNLKDEENRGVTLYLVKNSYLSRCDENTRSQIMKWIGNNYVTSIPRLVNCWENSEYTYYLQGSEYRGNTGTNSQNDAQLNYIWNNLIDNCYSGVFYDPEYYYTWQVYQNNKAFFDVPAYNTHYDIAGGYIVSYGALNAVLFENERYEYIPVYSYNPDVLQSYVENGFVDIDLDNWNKGSYNDNMRSSVPDYNPDYLYSTNIYKANVSNYNVNENNALTTTYNVLRNYYVSDSDTNTFLSRNSGDIAGVTINRGYMSETYNGLYQTSWEGEFNDQFYYNNIIPMRAYKDGSQLNYENTRVLITGIDNMYDGGLTGRDIGRCYREAVVRTWTETYHPTGAGNDIVVQKREVKREYYGHSFSGCIFPAFNNNIIYDRYRKTYTSTVVAWRQKRNEQRSSVTYTPAYANQMLTWSNNNTIITAPYYVFNRFPYKYQGLFGQSQFVKLNHGGGKPMPSVNRTSMVNNEKYLIIRYSKFVPGAQDNKETADLKIRINCETRPSHSQYIGSVGSDDSIYIYEKNNNKYFRISIDGNGGKNTHEEMGEIEGAIVNFDNINNNYNNSRLIEYL